MLVINRISIIYQTSEWCLLCVLWFIPNQWIVYCHMQTRDIMQSICQTSEWCLLCVLWFIPKQWIVYLPGANSGYHAKYMPNQWRCLLWVCVLWFIPEQWSVLSHALIGYLAQDILAIHWSAKQNGHVWVITIPAEFWPKKILLLLACYSLVWYALQGSYDFIKSKFKDFSMTIFTFSRTENYWGSRLNHVNPYKACITAQETVTCSTETALGRPPHIILRFKNKAALGWNC